MGNTSMKFSTKEEQVLKEYLFFIPTSNKLLRGQKSRFTLANKSRFVIIRVEVKRS